MISIIVAMTRKGVIGFGNSIPWHISSEKRLFRSLTVHKTILMGRKTFESIGHPLPMRRNIVVSSTMKKAKGAIVCRTLEEGLSRASEEQYSEEIFIIGGSEIYRETIGMADRLYISYIKKPFKGDRYFPKFNIDQWEIIYRKDYPRFEHVVYARKDPLRTKKD